MKTEEVEIRACERSEACSFLSLNGTPGSPAHYRIIRIHHTPLESLLAQSIKMLVCFSLAYKTTEQPKPHFQNSNGIYFKSHLDSVSENGAASSGR